METLDKELERENQTGENKAGKKLNTPVKFLTATTIIGDRVFNHLKENLGEVKDIMLDIEEGKIEYVVVEFGGFLGIGEKFFAVPFSALSIDTERHAFILAKSKEELEKAPGFDKDHWPETNSHAVRATSGQWEVLWGLILAQCHINPYLNRQLQTRLHYKLGLSII